MQCQHSKQELRRGTSSQIECRLFYDGSSYTVQLQQVVLRYRWLVAAAAATTAVLLSALSCSSTTSKRTTRIEASIKRKAALPTALQPRRACCL
jgi:hypothetical protein